MDREHTFVAVIDDVYFKFWSLPCGMAHLNLCGSKALQLLLIAYAVRYLVLDEVGDGRSILFVLITRRPVVHRSSSLSNCADRS